MYTKNITKNPEKISEKSIEEKLSVEYLVKIDQWKVHRLSKCKKHNLEYVVNNT